GGVAGDQPAEGETTRGEADGMHRSALEAVSAAREEAARAEERCEGGKRRLGDLGREIHDMLEVDPAEVANLAGIVPDKPLPDLAEVESKLERLRRDPQRLPPATLRAPQQLPPATTQHASLASERDHLVEAI